MSYPIDNQRLPEDIEEGANIGPSFSTSIITMASGVEQPNSNWLDERLIADIAYGIMDKKDPQDAENSYQRIVAFFRARRGKARGFRFRDWSDYEAIAEIAYPRQNQERQFELHKTYGNYRRRITRPDEITIVIYGDGVLIAESQYNILNKGIIEFKPEFGTVPSIVTADFLFDVPVRFDQDELTVTLQHIRAGSVPAIRLIQVRE